MSHLQSARVCAVIPVKLLAQTKGRLTPLLSRDERQGLACAMLADVLSALTRSRSLSGVFVVTGDAIAAAIARSASAQVIDDRRNCGITGAVSQASQHLIETGVQGMLVIPADVPLVTAADVDAIVAAHGRAPAVTAVAAGVDGGTNALLSSPPDAIPFCFGHDSFRLHCEAARARSIEPRVLELQRVAQDLDRPDDIAAFLAAPSLTRTREYLTRHGVETRRVAESASS